ncbi:helix-turn-helix domain-containing protein [Patulibacter sp. NPDC049589]|uniref:TetR/AcrR family transcriptional regulator n=1 Tax=Patulibacter sp. NPDC049589 TaxID=3154731 RepID=UPI00344487D8
MVAVVETERADAARNRRRLLEAARQLVAEVGASQVTMEAVAAAAQVGKGTVFRRFGDRVGLMIALLDLSERENQEAFMFGPPPLGPGAAPAERLIAFGEQRMRFAAEHKDVLLAAEACGSRRYEHPARAVLVLHVSSLLREARVDGDVELLTETLLGYLDVALLQHLRETRGLADERMSAGWADLVRRVLPGPAAA